MKMKPYLPLNRKGKYMKFNIGLTELIALVSLVIAVIGAVLGIINTIYRFSKDKIRLKVRPQIMASVGDPTRQEGIIINVVNLSSFPITINYIGLKCMKGRYLECGLNPQNRLPYRLESKGNYVGIIAESIKQIKDLHLVKRAYVITACGKKFYGNSKRLKEEIQKAKKRLKRKAKETT